MSTNIAKEPDRLYIARVTWRTWQYDLHLIAPDTSEQVRKFGQCLKAAREAQKKCDDWMAYRTHLIAAFRKHGFVVIKK